MLAAAEHATTTLIMKEIATRTWILARDDSLLVDRVKKFQVYEPESSVPCRHRE